MSKNHSGVVSLEVGGLLSAHSGVCSIRAINALPSTGINGVLTDDWRYL